MNDFEVLNKLGEGAFGTVYKIKKKDNQRYYAMKKIKMIKLSKKEKEMALNEVRIMASIDSPYVVKYKDSFFYEPTSELCIVMEFADKGDLQGMIKKAIQSKTNVEEELIWKYTAQILQGLKTLHDMNILHRDLKGANIFLTENGNAIKLGDLNVSKVAKQNYALTQTGTPYYLAPEVWKGEAYNSKCDIWSLGCVLYELAALQPPFQAKNFQDLYRKGRILYSQFYQVLRGNPQKIPSRYSQDLHKFIAQCLIISPASRPSVKDLLLHFNIKNHIKIDIKQEKAQLLKTMKLPFGGLHQIKNILPKSHYDEEAKTDDFIRASQNNPSSVQKPPLQLPMTPQQKPVMQRCNSAKNARAPSPSRYYLERQREIQKQQEQIKPRQNSRGSNRHQRVNSQDRLSNKQNYNQGIYKAPSNQENRPPMPNQQKPPMQKVPSGKK